jgi:hypothetical protein
LSHMRQGWLPGEGAGFAIQRERRGKLAVT